MASAVLSSIPSVLSPALNPTESVVFLNDLVSQMWVYINVAVSHAVKELVEPTFAELPGPLSTLHFTKIDLGDIPFQFDNVQVQTEGTDTIIWEIDVNWDGGLDVELKADYVPAFGVEFVKITGRVRVVFRPLLSRLPLIGAQQITFVNPPAIKLQFSGAADIADLSVVKKQISRQIDRIIGDLVVLPNRILVKVDPLCSILDAHVKPLGFLRIKVERGDGFKTQGTLIKDIPDMLCSVKFGPHEEWKTRTINNNAAPEWNEEKDFLLSSFEQSIRIRALEEDVLKYDDFGHASITVRELMAQGGRKSLPLFDEGNSENGSTITLSCEVFDLCADPQTLHLAGQASDATEVGRKRKVVYGLLTVLVARITEWCGSSDTLAMKVKTVFGGRSFQTDEVKAGPGVDVRYPSFDAVYYVPLEEDMLRAGHDDVVFELCNQGKKIAEYKVPFPSVLAAQDLTVESMHAVPDGGSLITKVILNGMVPRNPDALK